MARSDSPSNRRRRRRALDAGAARRVLGVDALELLPAGGADLDELLRARQLALVRLELRACRDVARLRLGQLRAEDLRHASALAARADQLDRHAG